MSFSRLSRRVSESSWVRVLIRLIQNLDKHDTPRVASAIAFDAFLSLIPLVAIAGYIVQKMHQSGTLMVTSVFRAAPAPVGQLVDLEFLRLSDEGVVALAPISLSAFVWVSSSGLATAMGVIETIYASELRSWWKRRAIAMACVFGGLITILITAAVTLAVASLSPSFIGRLISLATPVLIIVALVAAFYRIAIRRPRLPQRRVLPGAIVTVALWGAASALFSLYVRNLAQYATLYGNLATVAILLLWLWLLGMALIVGGEVNAELERLHDAAPKKVAERARPESGAQAEAGRQASAVTQGDASPARKSAEEGAVPKGSVSASSPSSPPPPTPVT